MFGVIPKPLWEKVKPADERNRVAMDMNCLLIRDADHVVVVETGAGTKLPAKQREIIDDSVEILPGVRLDRVHGHPRGTQTVRVSDRGETLFFSSDFMPDRHHLPLPWISAFDLFPLDTLAAKRLILRRAIDERWIVGFTHDLPLLGRISESAGKYRFDEVAD